MAQARQTQPEASDDLRAQALAALRKAGKRSSEEGWLVLQPEGGPVPLLAKKLKVSEYAIRPVFQALVAEEVAYTQGMGPGQPRKTFVLAEDPPVKRRRSSGSRRTRSSRTRQTSRRPRKTPEKADSAVPQSIDEALAALRGNHDSQQRYIQELESSLEEANRRITELEEKAKKARDVLA